MYNSDIIRGMINNYESGTVDKTISPNDIFYNEHYFEVGRSAVEVIVASVMASFIRTPIKNVLVLPSGHGRVLRHIVHLFPDAKIDACDLDPDAVDFCASTFGVNPIYSKEDLTSVHFESCYDIIWVGSLFTHTSLDISRRWFAHLAKYLSPQGVVIATVHGRWCEEAHKFYSYISEDSWQKILEGYHSTGYGFHDYAPPENHSYISGSYGISLAKPHVTINNIEKIQSVRIYMYMERGWCDHQDVIVYGRPSYDQGYGECDDNCLIVSDEGPSTDYRPLKITNQTKNLLKILLGDISLQAMPQWIGLATTTFCNLKCPHCQTHGTEEVREIYNKQRWSYDFVLKVADETLPHANHFCLTLNGEPLATPRIRELLNHMRQYDAKLHLTTNGMLMSKEILIQLLPLVSSIDISIDGGTKTVVETIRSGVDFGYLLNRIKVLTRACELLKDRISVPVRFVCTVMGSNIRDMPEIISLAHELGIQEVNFYPLQVFFPQVSEEDIKLFAPLYNAYYSLTRDRSIKLGVPVNLLPPFSGIMEDVTFAPSGRKLLVNLPHDYYSTLPPVTSYLDNTLVESEAAEIAASIISSTPQEKSPLHKPQEANNLIKLYESQLMELAQKADAEICWCGELYAKVFFNPNGDLSPCCVPGRPVFGNIHCETVESLWNGPQRTEFVEQFQSSTQPSCCVNCPNNTLVSRRSIINKLMPISETGTNKMSISELNQYWLAKAEKRIASGDTGGIWSFLKNMTFYDFGELLLDVPTEYPLLKSYLPTMASEEVQKSWTGSFGKVLLAQSAEFMETLEQAVNSLTNLNWGTIRILDFGCGWGRLLRLMYKLVGPESVFGVDPWDKSIEICRHNRVLGNLAISDYLPKDLPFTGIQFDLVYSFSVFTHLSEKATNSALKVIRDRISPDGILIITIRPEEYWHSQSMSTHSASIDDLMKAHKNKGFAFWPHNRESIDGDITFGETSISEQYMRVHWKEWEVVGSTVNNSDPLQTVYFLKPV